jgi:hypothetical protein
MRIMDTSRQDQQKRDESIFQFNLHIKHGIKYIAFRGGKRVSRIFLHLNKRVHRFQF